MKISIVLEALTGSFETDMKRANRAADKAFRDMERQAKVAAQAVGAAAAAGVTALALLTRQSIKTADELAKMSQKVGVSVESLSTLGYAADRSGVSIQGLQSGLVRLAKNAADAAIGLGESRKGFDALGVSVTDADGKLKNNDVLLRELADKFSGIKDGAEKTAIAVAIFGRSGAELLPMLNSGANGIAKMEERARDLGLEIDTVTAKSAEQFNDALDDIGSLVTGVANDIAKDLLPSLVDLATNLVDTGIEARKAGEGTDVFVTAIKYGIAFAASLKNGIEALTNIIAGYVTISFAAGKATLDLANNLTIGEQVLGRLNGTYKSADEILTEFQVSVKSAFTAAKDGAQSNITDLADVFAALFIPIKKVNEELSGEGDGDGTAAALIEAARAARQAELAARAAAREKARLAKEAEALAKEIASNEEAVRDLVDQLDGPLEQAQKRTKRAIEELKKQYDEGKLSLDSYTKGKAALEEQLRRTTAELNRELDPLERLNNLIENEVSRNVDGTAEAFLQMALEIELATAKYGEHSPAVQEAIRRYEELRLAVEGAGVSLDDLSDKAIDTASNALGQTLQDAFSGLTDASPWEALRIAATRNLDSILDGVQGVIDANTDAVTGVTNWTAAFEDLGEVAMQNIGNIAQVIGTAAGGGGQGAQIGAQLGQFLGGPIGSIIGGLIGGSFDDDPGIQVAGSRGSIRGRVEQTRDGPFGTFRVRTEEIDQPTSGQVADAIQDFDRAIASFLSADQVAAASQRLETFDIDLENGAAQISLVLAERFDAILETMSPLVANFVDEFSNDLEARVQALADVLALDRLAQDDDLLTGTLEQTLALIGEFGRAGETIGQTYQRLAAVTDVLSDALDAMGVSAELGSAEIARLAAELGEAAGSTERAQALLSDYYEQFYTEQERLLVSLNQATSSAQSEFGDIGLDLADFTGVGGAAAFREAFEAVWDDLTAEARVQWLEAANALGVVIDLTDEYNATLEEAGVEGGPLTQFSGALQELMASVEEQIAAFAEEGDFASRIDAVNEEIDDLIEAATKYGASEKEIARIRELGQLRINAILEEEAEAIAAAEEALRQQQLAAEGLIQTLAELEAQSAGGVTPLTQSLLGLRAEYENTINTINDLARASGRASASEAELAIARNWYANQIQRRIDELFASAASLVSQFYGTTAGGGNAASPITSADLGGIGQVVDAVEDRYERELRLLQQLQEFIDSLLLSSLSPLTPDQRLNEAQAQYEALLAAAQGGDLDALGQLRAAAQAYLGEAQSFYGGVGAYPEIFASVLEQLGLLTGAGPQSTPNNTAPPQSVFGGPVTVEPGPGFAELSALDRELIATELVDMLRDIVGISQQSLVEISAKLGLDLQDLVEALGVNLQDLTVATTLQLADISRSLGVDLIELADGVGFALGDLADEQSLLNDALEQVIEGLPQNIRGQLNTLLRNIETATTAADANAAIEEAEAAINELAPDIADLLAPFFTGVSSPTDSLLVEAYAQTSALNLIESHAGRTVMELQALNAALNQPPEPASPTATVPISAAVTATAPVASSGEVVQLRSELTALRRAMEDTAATNRQLLNEARKPNPNGRRAA